MTLDEVKEIVERKLPNRMVILIYELGMRVSVHSPEGHHEKVMTTGKVVAYLYATDKPGGEPPWRAIEGGKGAGDCIGDEDTVQDVVATLDSLCIAFVRSMKLAKSA